MPVELNIIESVTELDTTVTTVVLESFSAPGPAGPGVPAGGTDGQVLTKTSATDYATAWEDPTGGGGGAPTTVDYLVGTASGDLSAEIVVGTSPGGELGGTWASPTVDASHSGSTHAAVQAAAEATAAAALSAHLTDTSDAHDASAISSVAAGNLAATDVQTALNELDSEKAATSHAHAGEDITSGTVADARIASTIARDSEVTSAISTHEADTTSVHGIADTSALALTANHPSNATFNDHSARHEDGGADEVSLTGLSGEPADTVNKSLYDANTVLAANSDNTPAAVTMAASTILARLAAGNIKAASVAEILTLLDVPTNAQAILDSLIDAKGDIIAASAADTPVRVAVGANGTVLEAASGATPGVQWDFPPGYELSYVENTSNVSIASTTEGTPTTVVTAADLTVDGSTIVLVEFYSRGIITPSPDNAGAILNLHVSTNGGGAFSDLGRIVNTQKGDDDGGTLIMPIFGSRRLTPAAGTVQYRIVAWATSTTGSPTVLAGAGGAATGMPMFIRVTKV